MKIISPSFEILTPLDGQAILKHIELCGRVCYKSEDKITDTSAATFVASIIKRGHEAVLEHYDITVKFICDRGVSHELVGVVGLFESQERFEMFRDNPFEIMYLNRRVAYFKDYAEQKPSLNPPFSSVYVCHNMLPERIVFEEIEKR